MKEPDWKKLNIKSEVKEAHSEPAKVAPKEEEDYEREYGDDEDEWASLKAFEKKKKVRVKPVGDVLADLTPEQRAERCSIHKAKILQYICFDPVCNKLFCEKCRGDHNNHKCINEDTAHKQLVEFAEKTAELAKCKTHNRKEIEGMREELERRMLELEPMAQAAKQKYAFISKYPMVEIGRKIATTKQFFVRMLNRLGEKVEVLNKRMNVIKECQRGRATLRLFVRFCELFDVADPMHDEEAERLIRLSIEKLKAHKEQLVADVNVSEEDLEYFDENILLSHFARIDSDFQNLIRTMGRCGSVGTEKARTWKYIAQKLNGNVYVLWMPEPRIKSVFRLSLLPDDRGKIDDQGIIMVSADLFVIGGKFYIEEIATTYSINLDRLTSRSRSDMIVARYEHILVALRRRFIYAIDGRKGMNKMQDCERYSIESDEWRPIRGLAKPTSNQNAVVTLFQERWIYLLRDGYSRGYDTLDGEAKWKSIKLESRLVGNIIPWSECRATQVSQQEVILFYGSAMKSNMYSFRPREATVNLAAGMPLIRFTGRESNLEVKRVEDTSTSSAIRHIGR